MSALERVSASDVGHRLRWARDNAHMTQQEAASRIGFAPTALIAIESGNRRVQMNELRQLVKLYGVSVNALLCQEAVHVDLALRFRRLPDADDEAADESVKIISCIAKAEVELENLLGIKRIRNFPPERQILRGDVKVQAEQDALELRQRLGFGNAPIKDIVTLLEIEWGVRVYVRRIDRCISGLSAYDEALGPCMLLNAKHSKECRTQSAAHQCGRLISNRNKPSILRTDTTTNDREKRYADAFGNAFLMPPQAVMQKLSETIIGSDKLKRRHVIMLARFFDVTHEAMVRRLEGMGLVKMGAWERFRENGGITDQHVKQVLGSLSVVDEQEADANRPTTLRLGALAAAAHRQELLTEEQLSELLGLNRMELREILDDLEIEESEADAPLISFA